MSVLVWLDIFELPVSIAVGEKPGAKRFVVVLRKTG